VLEACFGWWCLERRRQQRQPQQQQKHMFSREFPAKRHEGVAGLLSGLGWPRFRKSTAALFTTAFLAVATALALWLAGDASKLEDASQRGPGKQDCKEKTSALGVDEQLAAVLHELTRRFFHVARELAVVARDIRERLRKAGQEIHDEQAFRAQLAQECEVAARFEKIRKEVLAERGLSEESITRVSEEGADVVRAHRQAVGNMLEEALGGLAPMMPGVQIPAELSENALLQIHEEMLRLKVAKAKHLAGATQGKKYSPEELGRAAALMSQAAEAEVLEARCEALGRDGEVYHTAMARHSRDPAFRQRMSQLDADHRRALIAAFRGEAQ